MLKSLKIHSVYFIIILLLTLFSCKKEPSVFEKQFDSDSKKIRAKIGEVDNSLINLEITIANMKNDFLLNADKVNTEISNIRKTQTELRDTLNNLANIKAKAAESDEGKTPLLWIIIYIIIFIIIVWAFYKFFKGKSEDEEEASFTTFTYEGKEPAKDEKATEQSKTE